MPPKTDLTEKQSLILSAFKDEPMTAVDVCRIVEIYPEVGYVTPTLNALARKGLLIKRSLYGMQHYQKTKL